VRALTVAACLSVAFCALGCDRDVHLVGHRAPEVTTRDIRSGAGQQIEQGRMVFAHYVGKLPSGEVFMSTRDEGEPHAWVVGEGSVIKGIDLAVVGMRPGGVREARIPPELHWGRAGYGNVVPKNATLTFMIEIVNVR